MFVGEERREIQRAFLRDPESNDSKEEVGLALISVLAFLRIGTSPAASHLPMTVEEATEAVAGWLDRPNVGIVQPTRRHLGVMRELARIGRARGPLLMDAHLAALAIEHGATLCTTDRDSRVSVSKTPSVGDHALRFDRPAVDRVAVLGRRSGVTVRRSRGLAIMRVFSHPRSDRRLDG